MPDALRTPLRRSLAKWNDLVMCKTQFTAKDGTIANIVIDQDGTVISVWIGGAETGSIELTMGDGPYHFHITHMFLNKCKGKGIGRACLRFHKECFAAPLTASSPFEPGQKLDGSHLTGDGLPSISKMRDEGIVCRHSDEYDQG